MGEFDVPRTDVLLQQAVDLFADRFDQVPDATALAPGRINIIGEHTDYSGGFVLPAAIPLATVVCARRNGQARHHIHSTVFGEVKVAVNGLKKRGRFEDYVVGALRHADVGLEGLDVLVHSNLPVQAGLSSSASVLVASLACFLELTGQKWTPLEVALGAREIENDFVGVPCGFMDQFACASSRAGFAMLLDCSDNTFMEVPASFDEVGWVVVYSGIRRTLAGGGYGAKVEMLKRAIEKVNEATGIGLHFPRFLHQDDMERLGREVELSRPEVNLLKHVVAENYRVHAMRHALEKRDENAVATLLNLGHMSLSELFGVSTPAIDKICRAALQLPGVPGIRLTGAGMGGSLIALVQNRHVEQALEGLRKLVAPAHGAVFRIPVFGKGVRIWRP